MPTLRFSLTTTPRQRSCAVTAALACTPVSAHTTGRVCPSECRNIACLESNTVGIGSKSSAMSVASCLCASSSTDRASSAAAHACANQAAGCRLGCCVLCCMLLTCSRMVASPPSAHPSPVTPPPSNRTPSCPVPRFGRDIAYLPYAAELLVTGSFSEIYRLNLEEGRFMQPLNTRSQAVNASGGLASRVLAWRALGQGWLWLLRSRFLH